MTKNVLKTISDVMTSLGIEYGFIEYNKVPIVYPYFVGEYQETDPINEDGLQESTFILTGFSRSTWDALETKKNQIADHFGYSGKTYITADNTGIAISYGSAQVIPTGDEELKKMQINMNIKEWKVNP